MRTVEEMKNLTQDLIASYDAQVDAIGAIIDNTYQALDDFKDKRAKLSHELKETLASRQSLRKKDFDRMMNGILLHQEEKEKEVKQSVKNFLEEQKREARELRDALTQGEVERMKKAQIKIEKNVALVKGLLKESDEQQKELTEELKKLLTKGKDLKIKDLKNTLRNLQTLTKGKEVKRMGLSDVATDVKHLTQDMATSHANRAISHAERIASVETLSKETEGMLENFQEEHAERKAEVNTMLESFTENLHKEVHQFMKEVHQFMRSLHSENVQKRVEVNDLLVSFQEYIKGVRKENAQRQREVDKLLEGIQKEMEGFRKENKLRHSEVGRLVAAVKEMWSTMARARRGAKEVSACSLAETKRAKPARGRKRSRVK
jgi:F0F1-type ATP synthase membrane subunit b/b'